MSGTSIPTPLTLACSSSFFTAHQRVLKPLGRLSKAADDAAADRVCVSMCTFVRLRQVNREYQGLAASHDSNRTSLFRSPSAFSPSASSEKKNSAAASVFVLLYQESQ